MHQAQITTWGQPPTYASVPSPPAPKEDELRVRLLASGLHRVVRSRASGAHYSAKAEGLPHVPGIDGVGTTEDGKTVYFTSFATGTWSEELNVARSAVAELPQGLDPIQAAGLMNPLMSSWMALKKRTSPGAVREGFSVLILGVTSASGRVAVALARALGAGRVVGAARRKEAMEGLGLDGMVVVAEKAEETDFSGIGEVDVVLDYVSGPLAARALQAVSPPEGRTLDYVHIGSVSSVMEISIPGAVLRSKDVAIRGSGPGSWSMGVALRENPAMLEVLRKIPEQPVRKVKLSDVEAEWTREGDGERVVFVP